jgi:type VI secretion system protein ImpI
MTLTLRIENLTTLPDGGPLSVSIKGKRGLDIGRDQYLDWTLPDSSRFISGKHCEVRWHDGAYWLHDISTNGTFLNGADSRLKAPHRLRDGDRFAIGQYIIAAMMDDEVVEPAEAAPPRMASRDENLWDGGPDAADPIDPRQLKGPHDAVPVRPDFLDWAADVPVPITRPAPPAAVPVSSIRGMPIAAEHDSWAEGPPPPPAPQPEVIPVPTPRRPDTGEARQSWSAPEPGPPVTLHANGDADATAKFAQLVARGAGLPDNAFAGRDPAELAEQFGRLMKLATDNMKQLLEARQQAKRLARSPNQTTVQAINNNPLKFAPTAEDALRIMFGSQGRSYLDSQSDRGLVGMVGSRKARLWDIYVARWQAHAKRHDNGILDTFMDYFARCYDGD